MKFFALLLALGGCVNAPARIVTPEGNPATIVTCGSRADCLVAVSHVCPSGWMTSDSGMNAFQEVSYTRETKTIIVQCRIQK
jgi:hypothetical protein